ncbi:MAG TPA: MTH938/NDUFAF3 family protein [Terriglobales bacterium]
MKFQELTFGQIRIDDTEYGYDIVIDRGKIRKRKKKPSKTFRDSFGHTPLSVQEVIPWKCRRLVVGTGTGALPVMDEVKREARRRNVELIILPTEEAMELLNQRARNTNAILHVTC